MIVDIPYEYGDIVFLRTDQDQAERMITGIILRANGILFLLACGPTETQHYEFEFCKERNPIISG